MLFSDYLDLLKADRSYRRFDQSVEVGEDNLLKLIECVRFTHSARNLQPLKYLPLFRRGDCAKLFPMLKWAGYLTDWDGPAEGERPTAYLIQCLDTSLTSDPMGDDGIQLEALSLGTVAMGLGCCIIKAFNPDAVHRMFELPENLTPLTVIAIGHPVEKVVVEDMREGEIKYWRLPDASHHVPKRTVAELRLHTSK